MWWDMIQADISAYLIRGERNVVIDTGPPQLGRYSIASALSSLNLTLSDIDLILNTHGHLDHVGSNAAIKTASRARVCIHKDDAFFLEDGERSFDEYYGPPIEALKGKEGIEEKKQKFLRSRTEQSIVDRRLEDDDLVDPGDGIELRTIHLPGHSPGSVGYYWEKEGMLFTGDSVSGLHNSGGDLPIITDFPAYEKSIRRLMQLPVRTLLCGHRYRGLALPPCDVREGDEVRQFLQDSLDTARIIAGTVMSVSSNTHLSLSELTDAVIARLPVDMGFKPLLAIPSKSFSANTVFWCLRTLQAL